MGQSAYLPLSAEITRDNQSEFICHKPLIYIYRSMNKCKVAHFQQYDTYIMQ